MDEFQILRAHVVAGDGAKQFAVELEDVSALGFASRTAFSVIVSKTVCRSDAELLITLSTSLVAVCCSNDWKDRRCAGVAR